MLSDTNGILVQPFLQESFSCTGPSYERTTPQKRPMASGYKAETHPVSGDFTAQIVRIRREATHVKYCIEVQLKGEKWQVQRRFRDLFQLHNLLRSKFNDLPNLPTRRAYGLGKWIFGKEDEDFLAERQREFQRYLNALVLLDPSLSHGALRLFLGLPALSSNLSLENALDIHLPEMNWKTPSKVDLRLLRNLLNRPPEQKLRLADAQLAETVFFFCLKVVLFSFLRQSCLP